MNPTQSSASEDNKGPWDARLLTVGWGLLVLPLGVLAFVSGEWRFTVAMFVALAFSLLYRIIIAVERKS